MDREDMPDLWVIDGEQKLPLIEFYKRQKMMKTRWVMPMSSTDLFIGLPDDVICHILSFLPTKYSARTSLLAKRWRFLWSRVPCLEFKCGRRKLCDDFVHPNIIDRVLSHHEANISSFRLSYTYFIGYDTETEFELWMDIIIARDIPNLTLSLRDVDLKFMMPRCLFTSQTLLDLSLTQCGEIPVGITVHFPALKRLQLDGVEYESDESLPHLLSGCPVLEELTVHATTKPYHWCISLPTLTSLVLKLEKKEFRVKLDTPALSYLQLRVSEPENIFFGTLVLDSLIEADVAHAYCPGESIEDNLLYADSVKNIFGMLLYNTKFLTLNETNGMKDPKYWLSNDMGVKFRNLTKLDVRIADLSLILSLLGNANQLRVLNISEVADHLRVVNDIYEVEHTYIRLAQYVEPKQVPSCLISHLQEVNMHYVTFPPIKVMIARYILINAKVLKMMKMRICTSDKIKLVALTTLEKGSPACELAFAFEIDPFDHDHEDWSKFSHHKTYI